MTDLISVSLEVSSRIPTKYQTMVTSNPVSVTLLLRGSTVLKEL
jgi:hypothetical protein